MHAQKGLTRMSLPVADEDLADDDVERVLPASAEIHRRGVSYLGKP